MGAVMMAKVYWNHVLLVDDNQRLLRNLAFLMHVAGFKVTSAATVEEALDALAGSTPDLIIADADMPGDNGYDLLQAVRSNLRTETTPFILTSPTDDFTHMMRALDMGADEFLPKPFTLDDVLEAVKRVQFAPHTDLIAS